MNITSRLLSNSKSIFNKVIPRCYLSSTLAENYYTPEQKELQANLRKLLDTEINPRCEEWEKAKIFPAHEVFKILGDAGYLGINKPKEYGGLGLDYKYEMAFIEAMGYVRSIGVGMAVGVQTDCVLPAIARFGSPELCKQFLEPAIKGEHVGCIGISEPGGGSDVAALKTSAVRDGDDWIINGQKMWITNSLQADWMCLLANTSEGKVHENKSLIIVPMDTPGVTKAKKIEKMGMNTSDTGLIYFDNVRVPVSNTVGEIGSGFLYQMLQFQEERLFSAIGALGPLSICIEETIDYTRNRQTFGKNLIDNQFIHFKLAELNSELELYRAATYAAGDLILRGENATLLVSMLKYKGGKLGRKIPDECLQFWGGMGYSEETFVSRAYRDLRLWSIGGGADEIMLGIISKLMGILPRK